MRISVDHRTTYRFSAPQSRLVQMLRLTPPDTHDQTVARWQVHVDRDARMRSGRDGWGNRVTMLYVDGPLDRIEIAVEGEVVTSHSDGLLHGVDEPLPPAVFLRATAATPADPAIIDWAREVVSEGSGEGGPLAALHAINGGLSRRFRLDLSRPQAGRDAGEAWQQEAATSRDLAQMFAVAARGLGHPARFVSGYSRAGVLGRHAPGPHGWAEAHVEGLGWVGFDPCTGLSPEEDYVRVAVALDASGAAPVAGSRMGEGEEELDVDVLVERSNG